MGWQRGAYIVRAPKGNVTVLSGSFQCNATSDPASSSFRGTLSGFTVTYSATGKFVVTIPNGWGAVAKPVIKVSNCCKDATNTNRFSTVLLGDYDATNRQFTIQCLQESSTFAVPADADNR